MKFSLKAVALGALSALLATAAVAAPIEKRDAASDRIAACFVGLIFTGAWPGSCQAAIAVDVGLIRSIALDQMSIDFTPANAWAPLTSSSSITATMLSIPGITLPIDSISQHIIIADNGVQIGNIDTPWTGASVSGSTLKTSYPSSALNVFSSSHAAFSGFISALSTSASHPSTLQGTVDAKLNLGIFGHLTISGIGFKSSVPFSGLNNLQGMKYIYLIDTNFDTPGFITLTSIINIVNPSSLSLKLGNVAFSTSTSGGVVGTSTVKNLSLVPGNNYVLSTTALDTSKAAATDFLNDLTVKDVTLILSGYNATSTNPALNAGLAALKSNLVVPSNFAGTTVSQPPYKNWSLKILPTTGTDFQAQVTATFQSPYYGYPVQMVLAADEYQDNYAAVDGISSQTNMMRLFTFENTLTFSVSGTGSATVTFNVAIPGPFQASQKANWQALVTYGSSKGYIPVQLSWIANIIVNNDGINRYVDWGNSGTLLPDINIAVGSDFASILKAFPAA
ncbi:hypothetical protein BC939DRAFT_490696 [Gamsiella multidivaricata]|uniref:uncharacterized protein n=1 Tax=Gamsiella multidivaricata TaxID=101098 RepID=UPI00221FA034|nr:uncharacterized protein BC939DRAFT_490696 [Gamsiella multidivaricata]KAG0351518.1 hypothetical protein BGZ54_003208 [Gamsiella multidivaricata]KAI7828767.1 hypothetical protein BC939DRAFT_490696 [Gamsiella multidivaricata]